MGSSATGLPPPKPYLRLYHLCKASHALSNIEHGRIKVTRISEANDPFELMALNFREGRVRTEVKKFRTALDSHTGLLCFSEDWTSPHLWSFYADTHRGICLGFNIVRTTVEAVKYKDKRIRAEINDETGDPFALSAELQAVLRCTKCHEWSYEREHRRFLPLADAHQEGGLYFFPLGGELQLAEVILGPNCEEDLHKVRAVVSHRYPEAKTFAARLAWQHFTVVPMESSVP
jgi:hypothetical protein